MRTEFPDSAETNRRLAAARAAVLEEIGTERVAQPRRHRALLPIVIVGALVAGAVTGGAIIVASATPEQIDYGVECYEAASLSAYKTTVAVPFATDEDSGRSSREKADPVTLCGEMWRMGLLGQERLEGEPPIDPNSQNFTAPEIVGCTMRNNVGAGFPRGDSTASIEEFCLRLGLTPWSN